MSEDKKQSENTTFQLPIKSWLFSVRTETYIVGFFGHIAWLGEAVTGAASDPGALCKIHFSFRWLQQHLGLQLDPLFSWERSCFPMNLLGMKILFLLRDIKPPWNLH